MSFPRRPSQNEDPWFGAREAYDRAIEDAVANSHRSRGAFPGGVHVDNMDGLDWAGSWDMDQNNHPDGLPFSPHQAFLFEVIRSGRATGQKQIATIAESTWWREANGAFSGRVTSWHPWKSVASGYGVESVIKNQNEYIPDNSVAAVIDDRHSGLDLGTSESMNLMTTTAQSNPGEWNLFNPANAFNGGGQLSFAPSERAIATWNSHGTFTDGEVLIRANVSVLSSSTVGGAVIRSRNAFNDGYMAGVRLVGSQMTLRLARYHAPGSSPVAVELGASNINLEDNQTYYIRLRAVSDVISAKFWLENDTEPNEWMISATDSIFANGRAGVGKMFGVGVSRFNHISVNRMGGSA